MTFDNPSIAVKGRESRPVARRAARQFERIEESDRETVPLCVHDYILTSILWLMRPMVAPDLPMQALVADSYATMRADQSTWHQYVEKIERLREAGTVTGDNYVLLRQSLQIRALILVETDYAPEAFSEGSVNRVLNKARENIAAEALADAAAARESETIALSELARTKQEADARRAAEERIAHARAIQFEDAVQRIAHAVTISVLSVVGGVALVGAIFALPMFSDSRLGGLIGLVVTSCIALFAGLSLFGLFTGHGFPWMAKQIQARAATVIRRWLHV
jgi:hypothetical protein